MEHKVFRVSNKELGFYCHYNNHHYLMVLIDDQRRWRVMKGKSIKTIEHLKKVKRSPVKLLVRSWELGSKSRLPRKDAAFYIIKKEPVQKIRLMNFTPVDNFARADYRGTLLPRIKEIKSHYL